MEDVISPLEEAYNAIYPVLMELNEVMEAPERHIMNSTCPKEATGGRGNICILLQFYFFRVFRNMSAYPNTLYILTLNLITVQI